MHNADDHVEQLRRRGLSCARAEQYDEALALYDEAIAICDNEEQRELITINKADAMIACGRSGPEVQALPKVLMRRRNLHHTFLAAYALMFLHRTENNFRRAVVFGETALRAAREANEPWWIFAALNDLGICYGIDSQFSKAIECHEQAMEFMPQFSDPDERKLSEGITYGNLGYNKLLVGETAEGLTLIHRALELPQAPSSICDLNTDLCYGYLQLNDYERATHYGTIGLELATEPRQIRNAHYLLGEAAYMAGDIESAESHFDELTKFYPQFRNLKKLLFALDLRSMVNLKL